MNGRQGTLDKVASVNGLRGLAIFGVLIQHTMPGRVLANTPDTLAVLRPLATNGWTGVNLFFILSGFVLYLPYADGRRRIAAGGDVGWFYRHRFLRLMPLYYLAALVVLAMAAPGLDSRGFGHAAARLLLLGFLTDRYNFGPVENFALWSIGVEILFSLVFPLLVLAVVRWRMGRVLALALIVAFVFRAMGRIWDPRPLGPNFVSDNIFGRIDEFMLGMAIARWHADGAIPPWARRLAWLGVLLVLLAWEGFYRCQYAGLSTVFMAPLNNVVDAGFCAILLAALAPEGRLARGLAFAPLQVAGMMCYSIYIWHAPILERVGPVAGVGAGLAIVAAVAALTYRYVEFAQVRAWRRLFLLPASSA
jgi:peptidoglycan/LPS O-acetylase OafA/YrhL